MNLNISKILLTLTLTGGAFISVSGKPAMRDIRTVSQPDGTFLKFKVIGDERMHFTITEDGKLLSFDTDGARHHEKKRPFHKNY